MIRVVLADDQSLVRAGFRMLLRSAEGIEVVGEAEHGGAAIALARELRPDVVLMDLSMPGVDGLTAIRRITADPALAGVRVVVLTTWAEDENLYRALRAGAAGFLVKDIEPADLLRAVRVVAAGESLLAPAVTRAVIEGFVARAPDPGPPGGGAGLGVAPAAAALLDVLTGREREVLRLVGRGLSNEEIADALAVSPLTAKTHVSRTMGKLGARDRVRLVVLAYECGLVTPGSARS
ncbi:response regulator transcription factor [Actinomadura litoris]|uniref:response regulator transcription factor n=1 Tax=Actinomadura litoris TaxID=2678616 RepID=UPI001FA6B635|nr:response regulator transcription factor [Actinomadura litoris]